MNRKQRRIQAAHNRKAEVRANRTGLVNKNDIDLRGTAAALIKGLTSENPAHKQHWMEWALRRFLTDEWVDGAKAEFKWPDGVNPDEEVQPAQAGEHEEETHS